MASKLPEETIEKIKNFLERFANAYPNSGVAVFLTRIIEDSTQKIEGFDERIAAYMANAINIEQSRLPKAGTGMSDILETHLEIMEDFLKILETGDVNVLEYVRKEKAARMYKDFLVQGIKLRKFSQEWSGIVDEMRNFLVEDALFGDEHDCATCPDKDTCLSKDLKQHIEKIKKTPGDTLDMTG